MNRGRGGYYNNGFGNNNIIPCLFGTGRKDDPKESSSKIDELELLEQKSFDVCDENLDGGLTWPEVEKCEVVALFCY